jgi:hypothetical protein
MLLEHLSWGLLPSEKPIHGCKGTGAGGWSGWPGNFKRWVGGVEVMCGLWRLWTCVGPVLCCADVVCFLLVWFDEVMA